MWQAQLSMGKSYCASAYLGKKPKRHAAAATNAAAGKQRRTGRKRQLDLEVTRDVAQQVASDEERDDDRGRILGTITVAIAMSPSGRSHP
mmetsp:Transcript_112301/g.322845  ORF Transcript_112301/g.322845 Transcript_112301/m.322845 type:complete len:90 (-) Transcript_112301:19-288(-)